jgi:DNA polymerase epsilon subunit 1
LNDKEQHDCLIRNVRTFSSKAYKRVKSPVSEDRTDTVCQRENSFYIDTVRAFRDRRYEFKDATKKWKGNLEKAEAAGDVPGMAQAKDMILLYDSLQLAHKCIHVFEAQREVALALPDVHDANVENIKYTGDYLRYEPLSVVSMIC